jgi:hypothetical protein
MAIIEAALAIPILLAMLRGGKKKRKRRSAATSRVGQLGHTSGLPTTPSGEVVPGEIEGTFHVGGTGDPNERYLPESYRLILDEDCKKMAVRIRIFYYDRWITSRYWELRKAGWTDPVEMAVDILSMDSPHCAWPPRADSSDVAKSIWDWLFPGIEFYYKAEIDGTLKDYKFGPMPGVIPLVVWANPEREFSGAEEKNADY